MDTGIKLTLSAESQETKSVPVKVEIFDSNLRQVSSQWLNGWSPISIHVESGTYGIRASLASGVSFDRTVRVESGELAPCTINLQQASPQESQEWAYLTQPIDASGNKLLSDRRYEGVWMRMWKRSPDGIWKIVTIPIHDKNQATWNEDGVTYRFNTPGNGLYLIQVGGPNVPWKNVALPSSYEIIMLVRPSNGPVNSVHPLDVIVSSEDMKTESLLSLIQRGDLAAARSLTDQTDLAEHLLYHKFANTNAAAVGGYFLLRVRDLERLHGWAENLASWFEWMADGMVIVAWQKILNSKNEPGQGAKLLDQARDCLLEAVRRGFPVYTEGLRLLRDGVLFFDRRAKGADTEITHALNTIGTYTAAADWSVTTTTFTGANPNEPDTRPHKGTPREKDELIYVFDVPIPEILRHSAINASESLVANLDDKLIRGSISEDGKQVLVNGSAYKSFGALQKSITGDSEGAWQTWRSDDKDQVLDEVATNLRIRPKP